MFFANGYRYVSFGYADELQQVNSRVNADVLVPYGVMSLYLHSLANRGLRVALACVGFGLQWSCVRVVCVSVNGQQYVS